MIFIESVYCVPVESVVVTKTQPGHNPEIESAVDPVDHRYVKGATPPTTLSIFADPSHAPLQETWNGLMFEVNY